jgi:hypothetical protein
MAQPGPQRTDNNEGGRSPRTRRAQLKRRARWLLAGGSAVLAIGIYIGLAVPAPFTDAGDTTAASAVASEPGGRSTQISATGTDEPPAAPTVTATESAPVTRSRGS